MERLRELSLVPGIQALAATLVHLLLRAVSRVTKDKFIWNQDNRFHVTRTMACPSKTPARAATVSANIFFSASRTVGETFFIILDWKLDIYFYIFLNYSGMRSYARLFR